MSVQQERYTKVIEIQDNVIAIDLIFLKQGQSKSILGVFKFQSMKTFSAGQYLLPDELYLAKSFNFG